MADSGKTSVPANIDKSKMQSKGGVNVRDTSNSIEIQIDDVEVEKIRDQKQQMIEAIGCYNNPGGPTC